MKYLRMYVCIQTILVLNACVIDLADIRLKVYNRSRQVIYVSDAKDTLMLKPHAKIGFLLPQYRIGRDSMIQMKMPGSRDAWEKNIEASDDNKLHLYVFSEDTLMKYSVKDVIKGGKYLRRLDISLEELEKNNWQVIYADSI